MTCCKCDSEAMGNSRYCDYCWDDIVATAREQHEAQSQPKAADTFQCDACDACDACDDGALNLKVFPLTERVQGLMDLFEKTRLDAIGIIAGLALETLEQAVVPDQVSWANILNALRADAECLK